MIVSLEAIFLATFVLISQNRLSTEAERRTDLDLQIGLLTEHELTRVLNMLDAIQDKLGIENDTDKELHDLEQDVHPEDVLAEMDRAHRQGQQLKNHQDNSAVQARLDLRPVASATATPSAWGSQSHRSRWIGRITRSVG